MIFINTVNGVERKTLFHSLSIFLIAGIMYICLFLLSYISGIFFHLHGNHRQLYSAMSVFGNVGFMGIPIVTSIYPENGMLYICVFTIIDQLMLWTAGVRLTSGTDSQKNRFDFRKLINPVTVSILLAVICVLTGIRLPEVLQFPSENRPDRHTSRNDLSWRCFRLYRCTEKYPETGLLWNCHPKNAFVSAFLLCITWISSGFFRNPHYHGSDFCNASYVLCGNDGKCLRIRWRLCNGWNSCYNYLFCFYTSIYLLDFSFYRMI